jgi:hypothetical protein
MRFHDLSTWQYHVEIGKLAKRDVTVCRLHEHRATLDLNQ